MSDEQEPLQPELRPEEEEPVSLQQLTAEATLRKAQLEVDLLDEHLKKAKRENGFIPIIRQALQAIVAGAILAAAYFFLYQPIVDRSVKVAEKESELAALQADIQAAENQKLSQQLTAKDTALEDRDRQLRVQEADYKKRLERLAKDLKNIQTQREQALALSEGLRSELKGLQEEYERFAQTSETEKEKFRKLAAEAEERTKQLTAQVTSLQQQVRIAKEQAQQVQQQVENLPGYTFRDSLKLGGLGPEMIVIPAGRFVMGSPLTEAGRFDNEGPQHTVTIPRPFALSVYEITFADYDVFAQATGRELPDDEGWGRGNRPVINVSWNDARAYTTWLSKQTGQSYRLPTEAEWEYAARAGTTTVYSFGDDPRQLNDYAWYRGNRSQPVGLLKPNAWGLYDMHGSAIEWVQDWYGNYSAGAVIDPAGPVTGKDRVARNGSWSLEARDARSARRAWGNPGFHNHDFGFRLARDLASTK